MQLQPGIRWSSHTEYYDMETGLQISRKEIHKYIIIKKNKYAEVNELQTKGHITYTNECKRNPQQQLFN